jgi:hypothetical protein
VIGYTIRDADIREVTDISTELLDAKENPSHTPASRWMRVARVVSRVPGLTNLMFFLLHQSVRIRAFAGTALVTSVDKTSTHRTWASAAPMPLEINRTAPAVAERQAVIEAPADPRR